MCIFFAENKETEEKEKVEEEKKKEEEAEEEPEVQCPLCQEGFRSKEALEQHAMHLHSVNSEGLQRLMLLMQGSHWLNSAKSTAKNEDPQDGNENGKETS